MKCCDAQQEHFGPLLGYCDHQMMKLMVRKLRGYDVSPMQCRTLTFLYEQQGDVTQKKLQESSEEWVKIARDKIVEGGKTVGQETAKAIDTLKKKTAATSHKPTRPAFKSSATVSKPAPAKKAPAKAKASKKSAKK